MHSGATNPEDEPMTHVALQPPYLHHEVKMHKDMEINENKIREGK